MTDALASLAMRDLTLVDSLLAVVEQLEDTAEDPELLSRLFKIDNLATRMRRNGENLLVLAGQEGGDPNTDPVPLLDVARAATSEIRDYNRVHIGRLPEGSLTGAAADDVSHLLAELLDNATAHSPDHAQVVISGQPTADGGLLFIVEDEGIGIPREQIADLNARLSGDSVLDERVIRHMGLYVASRIAQRHGLLVRLEARAFRGMSAYAVVPAALLRDSGPLPEADSALTRPMPPITRSAPAPAPVPPSRPEPRDGGTPQSAVTAAGLPRRSAHRSAPAPLTPPPERGEYAPRPADEPVDRAARIRADLDGFLQGERAATTENE
ncbi:hypothetical protein HDA32_003259 [Spinactinospora alkalitolerans]|uniref:histidine kinase n=1 Tax=Spinactinospora alkalitolerans TaxID=687207 RepID=A0A852TVV3_9ACTN|nr:ATP-binding protein [Spinactinospora alkalitolerans]NYE48139.1 hypothetical protein [Spinactinospora alkalitolerans]